MMEKREQLYEGKAKKVYATDDPELVIVSYKDDATAFNGQKKGTISGKGVIFYENTLVGEMAEWSKAAVSKIAISLRVSRVRIPLSPPSVFSFLISAESKYQQVV